jgi:hypothetical protein
VDAERLPEVNQFEGIINHIRGRFSRKALDQMTENLAKVQ